MRNEEVVVESEEVEAESILDNELNDNTGRDRGASKIPTTVESCVQQPDPGTRDCPEPSQDDTQLDASTDASVEDTHTHAHNPMPEAHSCSSSTEMFDTQFANLGDDERSVLKLTRAKVLFQDEGHGLFACQLPDSWDQGHYRLCMRKEEPRADQLGPADRTGWSMLWHRAEPCAPSTAETLDPTGHASGRVAMVQVILFNDQGAEVGHEICGGTELPPWIGAEWDPALKGLPLTVWEMTQNLMRLHRPCESVEAAAPEGRGEAAVADGGGSSRSGEALRAKPRFANIAPVEAVAWVRGAGGRGALLVVTERRTHSVRTLLRFGAARVVEQRPAALFLVYQLLQALRAAHSVGVAHGCLDDLACQLDQQLWLLVAHWRPCATLPPPPSTTCAPSLQPTSQPKGAQPPRDMEEAHPGADGGRCTSTHASRPEASDSPQRADHGLTCIASSTARSGTPPTLEWPLHWWRPPGSGQRPGLQQLQDEWTAGLLSNLDYLLALNRFAGARPRSLTATRLTAQLGPTVWVGRVVSGRLGAWCWP